MCDNPGLNMRSQALQGQEHTQAQSILSEKYPRPLQKKRNCRVLRRICNKQGQSSIHPMENRSVSQTVTEKLPTVGYAET